jgi:hypothetical protein
MLGVGGSLWLKASMMEGRRAVVLLNYPDICLTAEEKHGKPQSGSPNIVRHCSLRRLAALLGAVSVGLLASAVHS